MVALPAGSARIFGLGTGLLIGSTRASLAADQGTTTSSPIPVYAIVIMVCVAAAIVGLVIAIAIGLKRSGWKLREALSEDPLVPPAAGAAATSGPASSSRLIALLGMAVILILFTGVGLVGIGQLAANGKVDLTGFQTYFLAGATLFVPYVFNQLSNIGK